MKKVYTLLGVSLLLFFIVACQRECPDTCHPSKNYKVEGWIDDGCGRLKAIDSNNLRATLSDKGITVIGLGDYTYNQPCGLFISGSEAGSIDYVTFSYTAGYSAQTLPRTQIEFANRRKQTIPASYGSTSPNDLYFGFNVIGDVKFIIKKKPYIPGVDIGFE